MRSFIVSIAFSFVLLSNACAGCDPAQGQDAGPSEDGVVINEYMARNVSTIADEAGVFEDWIELFNRGENDIDLAGFGLSDNLFEPAKYVFPEGVTIPAGGFLIVFADGEPDQGPLHANFRLSGSGESLLLTDALGESLDQLSFGPQNQDRSEGRFPNGSGAFFPLEDPSPAASNGEPGLPDAGVEIDAGNDQGDAANGA